MYDFRLEEVAEWILKSNAGKVAIQMPEGLKVHAQRVADELEKRTSATCLIIADPCYGACDVSVRYSSYADVLVQFGHSEIPALTADPRILYVEVFINSDISELLERALPDLMKRIGVVTTVQHVKMLPAVKEWLERRGREVLIGRGDSRIKFEGQLLGCNISAARPLGGEVDQFLYIGSGDFHPLSVAIDTERPVLVIDPLMREVRRIDQLKERILRQRHAAITRAAEAKTFLVLVSTKVGQNRLDLALELKRMLESTRHKADIVLMEEFNPEFLLSFEADAYVSTACPRIAIDDYLRYPKPIITPIELEIALGRRKWSEYRMDAILG